jgi:hypothetical protein
MVQSNLFPVSCITFPPFLVLFKCNLTQHPNMRAFLARR